MPERSASRLFRLHGRWLKKLAFPALLCLPAVYACNKTQEEQTRIKAPLRNYSVTARLNNKESGTTSAASGILRGTYSETTKKFTYDLTFEGLAPKTIVAGKGTKGAVGTVIMEFPKNNGGGYSIPLKGEKTLTPLQERDLVRGQWYIAIETEGYKPSEIRGQVTIKQVN